MPIDYHVPNRKGHFMLVGTTTLYNDMSQKFYIFNGQSSSFSTEPQCKIKLGSNGRVIKFQLYCSNNSRAIATFFGIRINGVNKNTITIPATTTGLFEETTVNPIAKGDYVNMQITPDGFSPNPITFTLEALEIEVLP